MLKISAFVAYAVHVELINCSANYRRSHIEYEHTVLGFPAVSVARDLDPICHIHEGWLFVYCIIGKMEFNAEEPRRVSLHVNARQKQMSILHDAMTEILSQLADAALQALRWTKQRQI